MKKRQCFLFIALLASCGNIDSSFSSLLESSLISSYSECDHLVVIDEYKEETCYEIGLTRGSHCARCGKVFEKQEIIKPSHKYKLENVYPNKTNDIDKPGDFKCLRCSKEVIKEITYEDINMPIITIHGDLKTITKEKKTPLTIDYQGESSFSATATFKLQGSSSLGYPKKNYNIQFLDENGKKKKVELNPSWSKQSKYCLKANYIDFTQSRNVVSGKLYGDIVHFRDIDDEISSLPNGGAIDGFPTLLYSNDSYLGLYTLNIPKDEWLFGMESKESAILMSKDWTKSVFLQEDIDESYSNGWECEYAGDDDIERVRTSFNKVSNEIRNNDLSHVNVDRAIDSMLYSMLLCARDNYSKNILWITYDGVSYLPSVYDLDSTWGLNYDGKSFNKYDSYLVDEVLSSWNCNELWKKLFELYPTKVANAYLSLREGPLHLDNIINHFESFIDGISPALYEADSKKWPYIPSQKENSLRQIKAFIVNRIGLFDKYFKEMKK